MDNHHDNGDSSILNYFSTRLLFSNNIKKYDEIPCSYCFIQQNSMSNNDAIILLVVIIIIYQKSYY